MQQTTHHFSSTQEAYDACQCDDTVKNGDILVIASERVVGIADTWPFAVTEPAGELHQVKPGHWYDTARRVGKDKLLEAGKLAYALGFDLNADAASLV